MIQSEQLLSSYYENYIMIQQAPLPLFCRVAMAVSDSHMTQTLPDLETRTSLFNEMLALKIKQKKGLTETERRDVNDFRRNLASVDVKSFVTKVDRFAKDLEYFRTLIINKEPIEDFGTFAKWIGEGIHRYLPAGNVSPLATSVACMVHHFSTGALNVFIKRHQADEEGVTQERLLEKFSSDSKSLGSYLADAINNKIITVMAAADCAEPPLESFLDIPNTEIEDPMDFFGEVPFLQEVFGFIGTMASSSRVEDLALVEGFWNALNGSVAVSIMPWVDIICQLNVKYFGTSTQT